MRFTQFPTKLVSDTKMFHQDNLALTKGMFCHPRYTLRKAVFFFFRGGGHTCLPKEYLSDSPPLEQIIKKL